MTEPSFSTSYVGDGGSSLTVAGTLTNTGTLDIGNTDLSSSELRYGEFLRQ